jgi:hypothetical protein
MHPYVISAAFAAMLTCFALSARAGGAKPATLPELSERLKNHPQVEAILAESERRRELATGETGLPDPMLSFGAQNLPLHSPSFDRDDMTAKFLEFRQEIPNPALRAARSGMQSAESKKVRLAAAYAESRLKALLLARIAEYNALDGMENAAKRRVKLYGATERHLKDQTESGGAVYARLAATDAGRLDVKHDLNELKAERTEIEGDLRRLVGEVPRVPTPQLAPLAWEAESLYPVRIARTDVDSAAEGIREAEAAFRPNYAVRAAYMQRDGREDMATLEGMLSVPLWSSKNQEPKRRAAEAAKRGAEAAYEDVRRQWAQEMSATEGRIAALKENLALLDKKKAALDAVVAAAKRDYSSGGAGYDALLQAQIARAELEMQLLHHHSRHVRLIAEFNSHVLATEKGEQP